MVVYGVDCSDYDWDRGSFDVAAMARDGITFLTAKATEATNVRHVYLAAALNRGRAAGLPILGAYHVVRSSPDVGSQAAYFLAILDQAVPWWRNWRGFVLQVDLEKWPYDPVSAATGKAFVAELRRQAPGKFIICYASKGQYGDSLAGIGVPLWNANYPSSRAAPYRDLYPGDNGPGWAAYSGQTPMLWQYASTATVGSQPGCDINAFRGSPALLFATLTGGNPPMQQADLDQIAAAVWDIRLGPVSSNNTAGNYLVDGASQINVGQSPWDGRVGWLAANVRAAAAAAAELRTLEQKLDLLIGRPAVVAITDGQVAQLAEQIVAGLGGQTPLTAVEVRTLIAESLEDLTLRRVP